MNITLNAWTIAILFSLFVGGGVAGLYVNFMYSLLKVEKPKVDSIRFPPWLLGAVERLFFTVLVGLNVSGTAPTIIAWLALKLAINWNNPAWGETPARITIAFIALTGGVVSLVFAVVAGSIANGNITIQYQ